MSRVTEVGLEHFQACMSDFREANVRPLVTRLGDRILFPVLRAYHEAKILGAEEMAILRSLNGTFCQTHALARPCFNGNSRRTSSSVFAPTGLFPKNKMNSFATIPNGPKKILLLNVMP